MTSREESEARRAVKREVWQRQINTLLAAQIDRYPFLIQLRTLWRQLQDEQANWPVLLPTLALLFVLIYRRERSRFLTSIRRARG